MTFSAFYEKTTKLGWAIPVLHDQLVENLEFNFFDLVKSLCFWKVCTSLPNYLEINFKANT